MEKTKYFPSLEEFTGMAKKGNLIPVFREIMADMETPVSAFKSIKKGKNAFLLESVEGGEKWGRYSLLGIEPIIVFKSKGRDIEIVADGKKDRRKGAPLAVLKELLSKYTPVVTKELPRFYGGAVGYIGYDMVRFFEDLPDIAASDVDIYDAFFIITDTALVFDNLEQKIKVIANAVIEKGDKPAEIYKKAIKKIDALVKRLRTINPAISKAKKSVGKSCSTEVTSNFSKKGFIEGVLKAKEYIQAGDIIQVVL